MVVIHRADARWRDSARRYRVLIDGVQRALLGDDDTVQLSVTPGEHRLRLTVDWRGSREMLLNLKHDEIVRLECRPQARLWSVLLYVTVWRNDYISLNTVTH